MLRCRDLFAWYFTFTCVSWVLCFRPTSPKSCRLRRELFLRFLFIKSRPSRSDVKPSSFSFLRGALLQLCVLNCGVRTKNIPNLAPPSLFLLPVSAGHPTPCLRRVEENDKLPAFLMQSLLRLSVIMTSSQRRVETALRSVSPEVSKSKD